MVEGIRPPVEAAFAGSDIEVDTLLFPGFANEIEGDEIDNDCDGIGGPVPDTGETGDTAVPDADNDGVPDFIDPAPNSAGDVTGAPPSPEYGCGCTHPGTGPLGGIGLLVLLGTVSIRRRAA